MILCENGPGGVPALFRDASGIVTAWTGPEVMPALAALDAARAKGAWVAGWMGYEAGLALEGRLSGRLPPPDAEPLLTFGLFHAPVAGDSVLDAAAAGAAGARLSPLVPCVTRTDYGRAIDRVLDWIGAGDCYQVNLTFPLAGRLMQGTALGLYGALRAVQPVAHGAYSDLGTGPIVISCSPELFFAVDAAGGISARPMKGTAPRDADPARDRALANDLAASDKSRAENLMIVDLLRNDIGRIASIGTVKVPELFAVESFATLHQMSSRIEGRLHEPPALARLMPALFPCGSVTGAPKIRAMEIIATVEPHPRGVYCGAIGWMAPDGRAAFNVAIRTLRLYPDGQVALNVGGGVVADSTAEGEWQEALWKARFADLGHG